MRLTVATTTRDRRESVLRALESVAPQLESGDELIVVDNGSIDGTEAAVRSWIRSHCPRARLIVEPNGGTSQARNTAVAASSASIVCFLDDDATADPGWLAAMRETWERASPQTAVIGGPIRPDWHGGERPPWLRDHLLWIVTALDLGLAPHRLDRYRIWGANMSLRIDAVRKLGGFDVTLGPRPGVAFGRDEEEDLQDRLQACGFEIWWEPEASVHHHLSAARLEPAYFQSFMRNQARRHASEGNITARRAAYRSARTAARCLLAELLCDAPMRTAARINHSYWTSAVRACLRPTIDGGVATRAAKRRSALTDL
ncbi:MAG TPA: glycosyltransferase [Gaiellaceae bacterium]|nr:glycosyltransferase [Gaiellaceae bacterium]